MATELVWLFVAFGVFAIIDVIYAIVSSVQIEHLERQKQFKFQFIGELSVMDNSPTGTLTQNFENGVLVTPIERGKKDTPMLAYPFSELR